MSDTDGAAAGARILHETSRGLESPGQIYALQRTYATDAHTVRVTVHVDSHPEQSRLIAEAWDGKQWREVVRILGQDPFAAEAQANGYLPRERNDEKRQSLERVAAELLHRCLQVIAPAQPDNDTTDALTRAVRAVTRAVNADSADQEIKALHDALQVALTRWPTVTYDR